MLKPLYFRESIDFQLNELYIRREDGVKVLYKSEQTRCLYPDGTEVTTFLAEKLISSYMDFGISTISFRVSQTAINIAFRFRRSRQDCDKKATNVSHFEFR